MQTRSQTKALEVMKKTQKWRSDIKLYLNGIAELPTCSEKIAQMIKIFTLVNDIIDEDNTIFIEHRKFSILGVVMFMKIFTLRREIQEYICRDSAEKKITKAAFDLLATVEEKMRSVLKKIKNIRECALLHGYCPDKIEELLR